MPDLVEYTFSFQDLLGPGRSTNQRWIEIMEVMDQLFQEFVYPELQRTKDLRSIYTANDDDLDAINIDKYYYLFENIQAVASTKRAALWLQAEIIKAKNREDSIFLAVASLGLPRDAIELVPLYSKKAGEYASTSLKTPDQVEDPDKYFLTSRMGFYLDQNKLQGSGVSAIDAQDAIRNVLSENVIPEHIVLSILLKIWSKRSDIKIVPSVKPFNAGFPESTNTDINYEVFTARSNIKTVSSVKSYNQFII